MIWGILHRTVFIELIRVFFLAMVALTGILLLGVIFSEATRHGLGPAQVISIIPLLICNTMPYTLPTTCLFATCIVYGRLSHDNEILAVKAAGVNLFPLVIPAIVLGLFASAVTFGLYLEIIPNTQHIIRTRFVKDVEEMLYGILKRDNYFRHGTLGYTIHVKRVEDHKLIDALFIRRNRQTGAVDFVARAREAELSVDMENRQIVVFMRHCDISSGDNDRGWFLERQWPIDMPDLVPDEGQVRPNQLDWWKLEERKADVHEKRKEYEEKINENMVVLESGKHRPDLPDHIDNLKNQKRVLDVEAATVESELHMRPSVALGCLCFVLVGCPVGIWFSKSDYLSAFITCFLPIVVIYYPLLLCGINLAKIGDMPVIAGVWTANILMAVTALFLLRNIIRH